MLHPTDSMVSNSTGRALLGVLVTCGLLAGSATEASALTLAHVVDYLLVGRGPSSKDTGVKVSDGRLGELGTVPSSSVPDVDDNPPWPLPGGAMAPVAGTTDDGNVAVTHSGGKYDFSNVDIHADIGVRCDNGATGRCRKSWSGSSLTPGNFANDSAKMSDIELELAAAEIDIGALVSTTGWTLDSGSGSKTGSGKWKLNSGEVDSDTQITLAAGENVIVIDPSGNDMKINNAGLVINGPAGSSVIFKKSGPGDKNFLFSNASITKGVGGIGDDSILFAQVGGGSGENFSFSKVIVNGVSFWDLDPDSGGKITMNNVQGCGQWVANHLDFNDVQLSRCAVVPEPSTALLMGFGLLGLAVFSQRPLTRRAAAAKRSV